MNEYDLSDAVTETVAGALCRNIYRSSQQGVASGGSDIWYSDSPTWSLV